MQALLLLIAAGYWWVSFLIFICSLGSLHHEYALETCKVYEGCGFLSIADRFLWAMFCSITRDNLGPYKQKILYIPAIYLCATLVGFRLAETCGSIERTPKVLMWRC